MDPEVAENNCLALFENRRHQSHNLRLVWWGTVELVGKETKNPPEQEGMGERLRLPQISKTVCRLRKLQSEDLKQ